MLFFPNSLGTGRHQDKIEKHINRMLMERMETLMEYSGVRDGSIEEESSKIGDFLEQHGYDIPVGMTPQKAGETFIALYSLLNSSEKWIPTLEMEFMLAVVIQDGINDANDGLGSMLILPDYLKKDIAEGAIRTYCECSNEDSADHFYEAAKEIADFIISEVSKYETFNEELFDMCFWDMDYLLLLDGSVDQIRNSLANEVCGIVGEPEDDKYIIPENWKHSREFKFVNRTR